jgi:hypothetical protein
MSTGRIDVIATPSGIYEEKIREAQAMAHAARDIRTRIGGLPDKSEVRARLETWAAVLDDSAASWAPDGRAPHLHQVSA